MPGSTLRRVLLLTAFVATVALTAWSIEHAPMRAYGAIARQDSGF